MRDLAYVNGWIGPLADARISVLDRGFLFGDGVYEVVRTYGGKPFRLQAHLKRFAASCRAIRLRLPLTQADLKELLLDLLNRSGHKQARIYVQATRGIAPRNHTFPDAYEASLVAYVDAIQTPARSRRQEGLRTITLPDSRWKHCYIKSLTLLPNVLARQEAKDRGADEAILLDPSGTVREGAASNLFIVQRGVLKTHPLGDPILPGVSRAVVMQAAEHLGIPCVESMFKKRSLLAADEVLLSSTTLEVASVVQVDDRVIGRGRPGEIGSQLYREFRRIVARATGTRV